VSTSGLILLVIWVDYKRSACSLFFCCRHSDYQGWS